MPDMSRAPIRPRALVRPPSARLAEGIVTHVERRPVDVGRARAEWTAYVAELDAAGWEIVELPVDDESPDSVFIEDTVVIHDDLAIITRPGASSRRAETDVVAQACGRLAVAVASIASPGTVDGGDVLRAGDTVYVGTGGRTNDDGVAQLRNLLEPRGARVVAVALTGILHLKTGAAALPDGTFVAHGPLLAHAPLFPGLWAVPEPSGAQVVVLGERRLLIAADCPRSAELYTRAGYETRVVEIGEFQKLEGAVTCLSVLVDQSFTKTRSA
jgi:dimethylargininase